jgi:two-component system C4-dicarboxylate transport sensor histidine kinase DctB
MTPLPSRLWLILSAAVGVALVAWVGSVAAARLETQRQTQQLLIDTALRRELLRSEIERHRLLPTTLARNPQLAAAVDPDIPAADRKDTINVLNEDFEQLARADGAATLYLVDARGITRVASNHRLPTTFVGQDYSFRAYFRDAMQRGTGELFAQGTISGVPGLYLAQRLRNGAGVVVTKVEFTDLEKNWQIRNEQTLVVDRSGIVLLTSDPGSRFTAYKSEPDIAGKWISAQLPAPYQDWTLTLRRDIGAAVLTARLFGAALGGTLGLLLVAACYLTFVSRRRRETQRVELERLVTSRTEELENSNRRLVQEIEEHSRSEATVQRLRDNLAQANRLAILGQISAGVAHEINQPTAAIRTYADNAQKMLERGQAAAALATLPLIASLTERIGLITEQLREFARRSPAKREVVSLADVIDGSQLLLEQSLRVRRIRLLRPHSPEQQRVFANRTRLEQVLVNLIQNAMDAVADMTDPQICIETGDDADAVWISVSDNGPGVPPERRDDLFAPFSSSKPLGLGLGLVISRDIVSDLGGSLDFAPGPTGGAVFKVRIPGWRA